MMNPDDIANKMADTQKAIKEATETLKKAQSSAMKGAESLLQSYSGDHKKVMVQEMANIRKAMKTADSKELNRISERMIEMIKKCQ